MGYSERVCQLCGISFNVARIRTIDEPLEAAWDGAGLGNGVVESENSCCEADGCANITRTLPRHVYHDGSVHEPTDICEHAAGPACTSTAGYSGQRISVEDMRECTNVLCLLDKLDDWSPEPGDEQFELDALYTWVTGISSGPPEEFDIECLSPARHGVADTMINNCNDVDEWGTPMHPWCFEIFKTMSLKRFGKVHIDGLRQLWRENSEYCCRFPGFPDSLDVLTVSEQWHFAAPGTEYMVTNPVDVPGLHDLIQSCLVEEGANRGEVFESSTISANANDPFAELSPELRYMLMLRLQRQDVANLRLASRSFRQLPQSYFHQLVFSEMPWVWDIETQNPTQIDWYALWCRLSAADGGSQSDEIQRYWLRYANSSMACYWDWGYARLTQDEIERFGVLPKITGGKQASEEQEGRMKAVALERMRNGKHLPNSTEIKGLRNRRRIYKDVDEVLRRIAKLDTSKREGGSQGYSYYD